MALPSSAATRVGEGSVYAGGAGGEDLPHPGRAGDGGSARGWGVGGGGAATAPVTALVSSSALPPVDLSVVGQPLVGEGSVVEAVAVGYAGGAGGEDLPPPWPCR